MHEDRSMETIDVFDYVDYRAYLRDFYATKKASGRAFSFRAFSRKAKLSSPNHLKRVMDGERNLTPEMAGRFADACGLSGEARAYFEQLVELNQARTVAERDRAYAELTGFRRYRQAHRLDVAHAAYHSHWYIPAIRELAASPDFRADPDWIAKRMLPRVTSAEAKRALTTLQELGFLVEDDDGHLVQATEVVSTGPELPLVHIARYHTMMMERAAASIDLVPSAGRDISSLTLLVDAQGLERLKRRIQSFRRELVQLALLEAKGTEVVQLNFQLFPLTQPVATKRRRSPT